MSDKIQDAVAVAIQINEQCNTRTMMQGNEKVWLYDTADAAKLIQAHTENAVAARVQPLVDALNEIASMGYTGCPDIHMRRIARDALAAYKESGNE